MAFFFIKKHFYMLEICSQVIERDKEKGRTQEQNQGKTSFLNTMLKKKDQPWSKTES